jgi:uncharacterized membrane protein YdfJ with MMPL/SSD domain
MGHWSATHRKAAIFGWFAFVIVAVLVGTSISQNKISDVDSFSGESHRAEQALERAGLQPTSEAVFVQSSDLTIDDPDFRAATKDATRQLSSER